MSVKLFGFMQPWLEPWSWAPRGGGDGGGGDGGGTGEDGTSGGGYQGPNPDGSAGNSGPGNVSVGSDGTIGGGGGGGYSVGYGAGQVDPGLAAAAGITGGRGGGSSSSAGTSSASSGGGRGGGSSSAGLGSTSGGGGSDSGQASGSVGMGAYGGGGGGDGGGYSVGYGVGQVDPGLAAAAGLTGGGGGGGTSSASSEGRGGGGADSGQAAAAADAAAAAGSGGVSVGYGVGQVDPGLAAAAGLTGGRGGSTAASTGSNIGYSPGQVDPGLAAAAAVNQGVSIADIDAAIGRGVNTAVDAVSQAVSPAAANAASPAGPMQTSISVVSPTAITDPTTGATIATMAAPPSPEVEAAYQAAYASGLRGTALEDAVDAALFGTPSTGGIAAAPAPAISVDTPAVDMSPVGYNPGQVDPGLAAAANIAGGSTAAGATGGGGTTAAAPADNVSAELGSLQDQVASLNESIATMQEQDLVDQGLISALTDERDSLQTQFDTLNDTYSQVTTNLSSAQNTIADLNTQIADLNTNITTMQEQDQVDQGLINALQDQRTSLETERNTLQDSIAELTQNYDTLNETYAGTVADLDATNLALSDTRTSLDTTQATLDETQGLLTASQALNASLSQQQQTTPTSGLQTTPASTSNLSRIADIDPTTTGLYANYSGTTAEPAPSYADIMGLTPEQVAQMTSQPSTSTTNTDLATNPLGLTPSPMSDLEGNLVSSTALAGQMIGRGIQSMAEAVAPQSTATIGYGTGQIDPGLAAAAGYAPGAEIAVGDPNAVSQFGANMAEAMGNLRGRALGNTSTANQAAAVADIYSPETGLNLDALGTQLALSAVPTAVGLSGLALGLPGVMATGGMMQTGETAQQTLDNIDAAYARGELGNISPAQLDAIKSEALGINAPLSFGTGAVTNAVYGAPVGTLGRIGLGVVEGGVDEAIAEPSIAATAANLATGLGGPQMEVGTLNEAIIGGIYGGGANVATGLGAGQTASTTAGTQGPGVSTQAPAQPQAPGGGTGTAVSAPASTAIAGAPLGGTQAPGGPVAPVSPTGPVAPTMPGGPVAPTTPGVISIPGTNVTVNTTPNMPSLPGTTTAPQLGTGGSFAPGLPAPSAPDTTPQVDTTPPTSVDRMSQAADIINAEVAETGALSNDTAQEVAQTYNLSMQEVANLAEEAMGITPSVAQGSTTEVGMPGTFSAQARVDNMVANQGFLSMDQAQQIADEYGLSMQEVANMAETAMGVEVSQATGPSTSVTVPGTTEADTTQTQPTGIATITEAQTQPEGYVFEGEILGPSTEVSTEVMPEQEGVTIEGEVPSTAVTVPETTVQTPAETTVQTPAETTVTTDTGVVVFPDTADMPEDDEGLTVEIPDAAEPDGTGTGEVTVDIGPQDEGEGDQTTCPEGFELQEVNGEMVCMPIEAPFECPEGYEAVQINGEWRCQSTEPIPQKVRPTTGPYYRPNPNPAYLAARGS